ncbi:MAG TPA: hypothetical protein VFU21_25130 [Kofleriaceae bacterium]|nr:hypothetical protein [Kofleriaceae bacterium]
MQPENEYLGGKKAKLWTYIILLGVLIAGVLVVNFAWKNPELAETGIESFLGLPSWVFPIITAVIGILVFWLGLKIESDWPEALGALLIAGSVAAGEIMIGWNTFALGGLVVVPYVIPVLTFLILLAIGMNKSR